MVDSLPMVKQMKWNETWNRYDDTDPGVRESVTALNLLGINTIGSCEGHLDHGVASPWIDISVEVNETLVEMNKKADDLVESAEHLFREKPDHPEAHRLMYEYEVLKNQILYVNLQETVNLSKLLEEFYKKRTIIFRVKLVFSIYGRGIGRLISQGGLYQEAFPKEEQVKFMEEYRQEMKMFGEWLKRKWMRG